MAAVGETTGGAVAGMDMLAASLAAFRPDAQTGQAQATVRVMLLAAVEPGVSPHDPALHAELIAALADDSIPEARCARLWLAVLAGETGGSLAESFAALLAAPLWQPAQAWAFRALAYLGERERIAVLLPGEGGLNLAQAEAWLEAQIPAASKPLETDRIVADDDSPYPRELAAGWSALTAYEAALAFRPIPPALEAQLSALTVSPGGEDDPWRYEYHRLETRRDAALARLRAGMACNDGGVLESSSGLRLPQWERTWLAALCAWSDRNDLTAARALLEQAVALAAWQQAPRLALAGLIAADDPRAALELLEGIQTRPAAAARAALRARLGDLAGAQEALAACPTLPGGAARSTWFNGTQAALKQEALLRAALAERSGNSTAAQSAWREAGLAERRALALSRQAYAARRELEAFSGPAMRRDMLRARAESAMQAAVSSRPGPDSEALFFQSLLLCQQDPAAARHGFETLLRRPGWLEAECRLGGARLLAVIDALLSLGDARAALAGCEALEKISPGVAQSRGALAHLLYVSMDDSAGADALQTAADAALQAFPGAPGVALLAALGWLALDPARSLELAQEARRRGADQSACRAVEALAEGEPLPDEIINALPAAAQPAARLAAGMGSPRRRLRAFIEGSGAGWMQAAPRDPRELLRAALEDLIDAGAWDEASDWAARLEAGGQQWATDLAARLRLRSALQLGLDGDLAAAESALNRLG